MNTTVTLSHLKEALANVKPFIDRKATLPILSNVVITSVNSHIRLTATDLESAIEYDIPANNEGMDNFAVPFALLQDTVKTLKGQNIALAGANRCLMVNGVARINTEDAEEFPAIAKVKGESFRIDAQALRKAILQVVFSAATEDERPNLTGLYAELEDSRFTLTAADGFRLSTTSIPLAYDGVLKFNVQASVYARLARLLTKETGMVEVTVGPNGVRFDLASVTVTARLIEGTYPNWQQLVPKKHTTYIVANVAALLAEVRAASRYAKDGSGIIRFETVGYGHDAILRVGARAEEVGEYQGSLSCQMEGEPARIAGNARYFLDLLPVLGTEKVSIRLTTSSSPMKVVGNEDTRHVVMPMFVEWGKVPSTGVAVAE